MASHLFSFCLLFTVLLCIHKADLLPTGQNGVVDGASKDRVPPKSSFECEYKCASREHVCELDKNKNGGEKCTEECGKWQKICSADGRCRKECAFTTLNCERPKGNVAIVTVPGKLCMTKCTRWEVVCAIPSDLSPIISQIDDGAGGKNPFKPPKCLRTCGKWDLLYRCIKWICNSLPQVVAEDADGKKAENILADMKCIGSCVTWDKFGTCVRWKCFKTESKDAFQSEIVQRGLDDSSDKVGRFWEWVGPAIAVCNAAGWCD